MTVPQQRQCTFHVSCPRCERTAWSGNILVAQDGQDLLTDMAEAVCERVDCPNTAAGVEAARRQRIADLQAELAALTADRP